ncbi:expressed protein [Echinococcus multilocularis]|uniref:Expressed protein n=1 Tax=Echinococcus multilocularis TaxID=6211 RepID=A0A068YCC7_ECHMU|nr:expressed protein [Echinococcus multilocularis]
MKVFCVLVVLLFGVAATKAEEVEVDSASLTEWEVSNPLINLDNFNLPSLSKRSKPTSKGTITSPSIVVPAVLITLNYFFFLCLIHPVFNELFELSYPCNDKNNIYLQRIDVFDS